MFINFNEKFISISSNPSGADIVINDQNKGKTPVIVNLKRDLDYTVKIALPGYMPYELNLVSKVDGWIIGNIVFGGLIGLIVDAASGGMYKLTPDQVHAELRKGDVYIQKGNNIYIAVVMKVDPTWVKIGTLQKLNN